MEGVSFQDAFNAVFTLSAVAYGWIMSTIWGAVRDMQSADKVLAERSQPSRFSWWGSLYLAASSRKS